MRRRIAYNDLDDPAKFVPTFMSDTSLLTPLQPYTTEVKIDQKSAARKDLTLLIHWRGGQRTASLVVIRTSTGGTNLW